LDCKVSVLEALEPCNFIFAIPRIARRDSASEGMTRRRGRTSVPGCFEQIIKIDWDWLDSEIAPLYSDKGRPGIETRFILGLCCSSTSTSSPTKADEGGAGLRPLFPIFRRGGVLPAHLPARVVGPQSLAQASRRPARCEPSPNSQPVLHRTAPHDPFVLPIASTKLTLYGPAGRSIKIVYHYAKTSCSRNRSNRRIQVQWPPAALVTCDPCPVLCAARRAAKVASRTGSGVRDFDWISAATSVGRTPRMKWAALSRFSGASSQ
jgi:hypothetical protein